jgi:hypothetical protein
LTHPYDAQTSGCLDINLHRLIFDTSIYNISPISIVLYGALWGADCNTLLAASKLHKDSECLQYIPVAVRKQFLLLVARELAVKLGE